MKDGIATKVASWVIALPLIILFLYLQYAISDGIEWVFRHFGINIPPMLAMMLSIFSLGMFFALLAISYIRWFRDPTSRKRKWKVAEYLKQTMPVNILGGETTTFFATHTFSLAVPNAVVAIDRDRGLFRLKSAYQPIDVALPISLIKQIAFVPGDFGDQIVKRGGAHFLNGHLPSIRLEFLSARGEEALLYYLVADTGDERDLRAFAEILRGTKGPRPEAIPSREELIAFLPPQGNALDP
jgi:hypothetical protein